MRNAKYRPPPIYYFALQSFLKMQIKRATHFHATSPHQYPLTKREKANVFVHSIH